MEAWSAQHGKGFCRAQPYSKGKAHHLTRIKPHFTVCPRLAPIFINMPVAPAVWNITPKTQTNAGSGPLEPKAGDPAYGTQKLLIRHGHIGSGLSSDGVVRKEKGLMIFRKICCRCCQVVVCSDFVGNMKICWPWAAVMMPWHRGHGVRTKRTAPPERFLFFNCTAAI